jgi:hypothetical protein
LKKAPGTVPDNYICKICNIPGHLIKDCPNKPPPNTPSSTYICNICHIPGHLIRECPTIAERNSNKDKKISGTFCFCSQLI